jgi:hypothetical protein
MVTPLVPPPVTPLVTPPAERRLRIFAFDPSLATRLDTAFINELTVEVAWESGLKKGPIGEYLEVVDADPASGVFYRPVNLNEPLLLAQDGLPPSESNPQFHQQMVYAVAMNTIRHFERALGRVALWADRTIKIAENEYHDQFVRRLRIYPHALRDRNAYYSPAKKALLFGYFPVTAKDADNTPGTMVFTCLSHDIVAHEVTHALLDGVHPRFNEPTNADVHAFHEAFADIVALFQHFTYPAVLENQIQRTRGNLHSESLLGQLAQQFGKATGRGSALRDALGEINPENKRWELRKPDAQALEKTHEPHARGAILVAAVFRAFLLMYRARSADLFRIATLGTGKLPDGDIHPDLMKRLAAEAACCAERILQMCIRAIDYCPPVDITFGDFLRAVVTADVDFAPTDNGEFRLVFIESFREWGIYPRGVKSMGLDALVWPSGAELFYDMHSHRQLKHERIELIVNLKDFVTRSLQGWDLESDRHQAWISLKGVREEVWKWLVQGDTYGQDFSKIFGLVTNEEDAPKTVYRGPHGPTVEIHAARPALRRTAGGSVVTDLVLEATQRRRGYFDPAVQKKMDKVADPGDLTPPDFKYRTGCTIIIDPRTTRVRRVIRTSGTIADDHELDRVRKFLTGESGVVGNAFDANLPESIRTEDRRDRDEPFALLHQLEEG